MPDTNVKGNLRPLALPQILRHLSAAGERGALVLTGDGEQHVLLLDGQVLLDAGSSRGDVLLSHRLMAEGALSRSANDALQARVTSGEREGQALVQLGVLDPQALWRRTAELVLDTATQPFSWTGGEYAFLDGQVPAPGRFRQDLCVDHVIAEGIRRVKDRELFREVLPSDDLVLQAPGAGESPVAKLHPYERYVRDLLDGRRTVATVATLSELGEFETRRTLFVLMSTGYARAALGTATPAEIPEEPDFRIVFRTYNGMFASLHGHLLKEVGPIASQVMEKCLGEARELNPDLLQGVSLDSTGCLDGILLERNLRRLPAEQRRETVVGGLNEFLYSALLAVKRTLGVTHEAEVVRLVRDQAPPLQTLGV